MQIHVSFIRLYDQAMMQKAQLLLYHLEVEKRHVQLDTLWILYMYDQTNQAKNKK